jgi:hypothetical protein
MGTKQPLILVCRFRAAKFMVKLGCCLEDA